MFGFYLPYVTVLVNSASVFRHFSGIAPNCSLKRLFIIHLNCVKKNYILFATRHLFHLSTYRCLSMTVLISKLDVLIYQDNLENVFETVTGFYNFCRDVFANQRIKFISEQNDTML